jgi:hypothetical protein
MRTFEVEEEENGKGDHVIRGPDLSESAMKEKIAISKDDLRRSRSGIKEATENIFALAAEQDIERGSS